MGAVPARVHLGTRPCPATTKLFLPVTTVLVPGGDRAHPPGDISATTRSAACGAGIRRGGADIQATYTAAKADEAKSSSYSPGVLAASSCAYAPAAALDPCRLVAAPCPALADAPCPTSAGVPSSAAAPCPTQATAHRPCAADRGWPFDFSNCDNTSNSGEPSSGDRAPASHGPAAVPPASALWRAALQPSATMPLAPRALSL